VLTVTDETFDERVLQSEGPVVVDFWAPWCHPCEAVTRALEELEAESSGRVGFAKLDIDANPGVAARYDVLSIPTVMVFDGGEPRTTITGARRRRHFERVLAQWVV
jgi:thioredoxin 1